MRFLIIIALWVTVVLSGSGLSFAEEIPNAWQKEWPKTDFSKKNIAFSEVLSGGPQKDGIPAIDEPFFKEASQIKNLGDKEPVLMLKINKEVKAYPLQILMWHEIVNDEIDNVPVIVTYCPLCNAAVVFDRRLKDRVLDFGVSGKLRYSDMIMYDRQTESWWQQFTGLGIVGSMAGETLKRLPARVVPYSFFKKTYPKGKVLVASNGSARRYGQNPYVKYDDPQSNPFLYTGEYQGPGQPLSYVVAIEKEAWLLNDLRQAKVIQKNDLRLEWQIGMNSALDEGHIKSGRDIGFVRAQRKTRNGYKDIPYDMTFAFAFKAFHPDGKIYINQDQ